MIDDPLVPSDYHTNSQSIRFVVYRHGKIHTETRNYGHMRWLREMFPEAVIVALDDNQLSAPTLRRKVVSGCRACNRSRHDPMMPYHDASPNCQSGHRPHCTCDTCF